MKTDDALKINLGAAPSSKSIITTCKQWWLIIMTGLTLIFISDAYAAGIDKHSVDGSGETKTIEKKGPHRGRLVSKDNFTAEITIFERNMPPHFRVYLYENDKPISPLGTDLKITLKRFSGEKNVINFKAFDDYLQSIEVVTEPHSFDVDVQLIRDGKKYAWSYATYEGRVTIQPEVASAAGIQVAAVKGVVLKKTIVVVGKIMPNDDTLAPIYPRYSGIIKSMTKHLGDHVVKGEVLATIESNESLQNYTIYSPISGTVVKKLANAGELAKGDKPIYEVANLDTVRADLTLYRKEAALVKKGMQVIITGDEGKPKSVAEITYISPLGIEDSQTTLARAVLPNQEQQWLPGMYVNAQITFSEKSVAVAVPHSALQHLRDWNVVFIAHDNQYEAAPVQLGEQDDEWVEIVSGIKPGQSYVKENSFFLKADLGKDGASHDH